MKNVRTIPRIICLIITLLTSTEEASCTGTIELTWIPRASYATISTSSPLSSSVLGRHHPIVFANETHGFLLGGTTSSHSATNDFFLYDEATDQWFDLTDTSSTFPGTPRSFGYGVVLKEAHHPKAYVGFGASDTGDRLKDWWEFDMTTHVWKELTPCPGPGRRHPSVVPVYTTTTGEDGTTTVRWQIHVGLGDGYVGSDQFTNWNDYWSYDIDGDEWTQLPNFPGSPRHHPFFFGIGNTSFGQSFV